MPARSVLSLPIGIAVDGGRLLASTAELVSRAPGEIILRGSRTTAMVEDLVVLETELEVTTDRGTVDRDGQRVVVTFGHDNGEPVIAKLRLA
jgi:hypothetical protein